MEARAYLDTRRPEPPEALARWLRAFPLQGVPPLEGIANAAMSSLDQARQAPGRVRGSAFHLLAADALLTYACESAMEEGDPDESLEGLLLRVVGKG